MADTEGAVTADRRVMKLSVVLSACSMVVALGSLWWSAASADRAYARALNECWNAMKPVYSDFGLSITSQPRDFESLLAPYTKLMAGGKP